MKQKWVKRIARAMLPCFLFFVFSFSFVPKVYAAEANVDIAYGFYGRMYSQTPAFRVVTASSPVVNGSWTWPSTASWYGDVAFYTNSQTFFYDNVKVYMSYYYSMGGKTITPQDGYNNIDNWYVSYLNDYGMLGTTTLDSWNEIDGNTLSSTGKTYALEASFVGSELHPISELTIRRANESTGFYFLPATNTSYIYFPSIRVITSVYSAELDALDKVADEIAAQSDILLAMKGDIVAILQDIYAMTGDMYEAQNLLNSYIAQLLPLIQDIDLTTTNIYNLLSTQLRLLETAIENAATTIEAAISAQTAAMIAYLEQYFNTGNEVPDDTYQQQQDASNILDQMESLEKPNVDTIVPEIGDYSDSGVSGVLSAIFSSNLIVTMMTLSASFAFGAYVLFGKRE